MAENVPAAINSRLKQLYARLVHETPEHFKAGALAQDRIESVLGHPLEFSIPLRLDEIASDDFQGSATTHCARSRPAFSPEAMAEFEKHVKPGASKPVPPDECGKTR